MRSQSDGDGQSTPNMSKPASIRDVARLAGVSTQSVTRVAHGSPSVSPQLREKVVAAMNELGYRPNRVARALRAGKTRMLGLMVDDLETSGSTMMTNQIMTCAAKRGYGLSLIPRDAGLHRSLIETTPFVSGMNVDGLIVNGGADLTEEVDALFAGVPVLAIGGARELDERWMSVDMNQHLISELAVNHLLELGHETVYHIGGQADSLAAQARVQAWQGILRQRGLRVPDFKFAGWWAADGYRVGLELARDRRCTAVYAANDTLAIGLIQALRENGLSVPEDVSVVGVDDSLGGYYAENILTTVRQRYDQAGELVVESLVDCIENGGFADGNPVRLSVGSDLVVRRSTAAVNVA